MKIISHRGCTVGPDPQKENHPNLIKEALSKGYGCEVDVWLENDHFYLGHDKPDYETDSAFLRTEGLICHAKNQEALQSMLLINNIHCFWHQNDDFTLTSRGLIWTFTGKRASASSVIMLLKPGMVKELNESIHAYGICTDYCDSYKEILDGK